MSLKRRNHNNNFKLKVALSAIKGDTTIAELVSRYKISSSMVHLWKKTLLTGGADVFANSNKSILLSNPLKKMRCSDPILPSPCSFPLTRSY